MPRVVHFEISADQPERAIQFYQSVFGWKVDKWDGPQDYWLIATGADNEPGINGGLMQRPQPGASITNTVQVTSVDDFAARVEASDGQIVQPKMAIPGVGYLAYCQDTEGNPFGIMEMDETAA